MDAKLQSIFRAADLPDNIDDISDGDNPEPVPDFSQDLDPNYHERWIETNDGLNEYLRSLQPEPSRVDLVSITKKDFNWLLIMFIKIVKY